MFLMFLNQFKKIKTKTFWGIYVFNVFKSIKNIKTIKNKSLLGD